MEDTQYIAQKKPKADKITFTQLAAYGAGGIIPIALFNVAGILVGLMGNISLGLSAFWLGLILIVPRLWDSFSDPIIGHLSDNTRSRWGRRRPYLLIGGILSALFFAVIWYIPKGETVQQWFPTESGYQVFQLIYILVTLLLFFTAVNLFEIPHGALGMEMASDPHERTRLFSAKSFVGNLFAMSTPWLFWMANLKVFKGTGTEIDGMRYVSLMIAALIIPLSIWWFIKLKEPKYQNATTEKKKKKTNFWKDMKMVITNKNFVILTLTVFTLAMGFNFVNLLGSYIPIFYVFGGDKLAGAKLLGINGTIWAITGVLAVFPLNWISPKLGKRNTLMLSMFLMIAAQLSKIVCYNPNYPYLIIIPTILLSAGMLFFFTLGSSMVGDICDEEELNTGQRSEGSFYAVFWWFIKLGTALASFVAGALIVLTMFDEVQVTKVDKYQSNLDEISEWVNEWKTVTNPSTEIKKTPNKVVAWFQHTFHVNEQTTLNLNILQKNALAEAKDYQSLLLKEMKKEKNNAFKFLPNYSIQYDSLLNQNLSSVQQTIQVLSSEKIGNDSLLKNKNYLPNELIITKLNKLQATVFDIQAFLRNKSLDPETKNKDHYEELSKKMAIVQMALNKSLEDNDLYQFEMNYKIMHDEIVILKKQTPYTLLMMRVVEIGLPILLSLIALFFILRYTLTDKRTMEIKELLEHKMNSCPPTP